MSLEICPWNELHEFALKAIQSNDLIALGELDGALHHRFFAQLDAGSRDTQSEFAGDLWSIADSLEGRVAKDDRVRRWLTRWDHLAELADAFSQDLSPEQAARELMQSRKHGDRLMELVAAKHPDGIRAGELAQELGIIETQMSNLLGEFEEVDLVERRKRGKYVYVSLGLIGRVVTERRGPSLYVADARIFERSPIAQGPMTARLAS